VSEELDKEVTDWLAYLMFSDTNQAEIMQRLWKDRAALVDAIRAIRDWDMMSAEARTLERVDEIVKEVLQAVGETE